MAENNANVLNLGKTPTTTVLKLAWPTILEQIAFTVLNFADTAMVGVLGAVYTAAVGISAPVLWLAGGIMAAVSVGFSVQVAQKIGSNNMEDASKAAAQSISAAVVLGALLTIISLIIAPFLPKWLGADAETAVLATQYFFVMSFSGLMNMCEVTFSAVLRCSGDTKSPLIANSVSILLNIVLNYLFIFPTRTIVVFGQEMQMWGAGLGVGGAALGSVISVGFAGLLLVYPLLRNKRGIKIHAKDVFGLDKAILTRAKEIGVPVALERITLSLGQVFFIRIVSTMGTSAIAAHHLAIQAESLSYMPSFGFAVAATTLVGQSIGAGEPQKAKQFGIMASNMGSFLMTLTGFVLFFGGGFIVSLFTPDAAVVVMGAALLKIVAFAQPFEAGATIYAGALRGAGDSKWPFYINLVGVWGFRILLSCLFVFGFGWGLNAVWVAMLVDLVFRGIVCRKRFLNSIERY